MFGFPYTQTKHYSKRMEQNTPSPWSATTQKTTTQKSLDLSPCFFSPLKCKVLQEKKHPMVSLQTQVVMVVAIAVAAYVTRLVARSFRFVMTTLFLVLPLLVLLLLLNNYWLWAWAVLVNSITMGAYAADKVMSTQGGEASAPGRSASQGARRVSEKVLLGLSLVGGYPAAFVSQEMFRHKSSKSSFQWKFWIVVGVVNSLLVIYLLPS